MNESLKRISENCNEIKAPEAKNSEAKALEKKHLETKNPESNMNPEASSALSPIEKKIRNLEKKLQQISRLKSKLESGEKLEQTQVNVALKFIISIRLVCIHVNLVLILSSLLGIYFMIHQLTMC